MACQRLALVVSLLALPLADLAAQEDRITGPLDRSRTVLLKGNVHPKAQAQYDRGPVEPSFELGYVTLLLKPSPGQQAALEQLLAEQQDPSSPHYHKWLTPEQYAERFGLSPSDVAAMVSWLQSEGLAVNDIARGRHWIAFTGTAGQIGSAFHTGIRRYIVEGEAHFANASEPSVPAALAAVISGLRGLDDFDPKPMYKFVPASDPAYNSGGGHYLAPDDFAAIYNLNPLYSAGIDGAGQKIAIAGRTDINLSDIQAFRRRFNLPANDPQMVLYGPDPGINSSDLGEADLDVEWSGAVARNATIVYVYSKSVDTAAQYAVDQNLAPVLSFSYGACEPSNSPAFRSIAQQASSQGITWLAASGDSGAAGCDKAFSSAQATKGLAVTFPASIPEITAVGGTMFNEGSGTYWDPTNGPNLGSALSYIPETAWNESGTGGLAASGGGASVLFSKPSWQTGPGVPNDNARDVPDVALSAAAHDGYTGVTGGRNVFYSGTSAPTPSFAGIAALLNQYLVSAGAQAQPGLGNINPALYRLALSTTDVFRDITTGDNLVACAKNGLNCQNGSLGYKAGSGYDLVTGLGSVDAYQLVTQWNNQPGRTTTTLTADSTTITVNGAVKLTAAVRAASGSGTPSGTVSFNVADTSLGSAPLTVSGGTATAILTVSASQLPVGAGAVWAIYGGDGSFSGSSASLTVTVGYPAGSSVVAPSISPNPVFQSAPDAQGYSWFYSVALKETAGVATTLTNFTIDGLPQQLSSLFGSTKISPNGTLSSSTIRARGLSVPITRTFGFAGADAGGETWSQQVSAVFYGISMALSGAPSTVQQNQGADPSCQWSQQLYLQEQSGFGVQLTGFLAGTNDLGSQIQQYFGTTQLAPFGSLEASVCWSGITPIQSKTYEIDGTAGNGSPVTATLAASFVGPPATAVVLSVSPAAVSMSTGSSTNLSAAVALNLTGAAQWTASILLSGRTTNWLQVSPVSGSTSKQLTLLASATGLVNGVYNATLVIQASNAIPQYINVPVVFVVGASSTTSVTAVTNAASFQPAVAPGSLATVWGSQLAPSIQQAGALPLPLAMQGASVTVNGVPAPLLYVSPGQMNIQIPYETGAGTAVLGVNNNGQIASYSFPVAPSGPGIFPNAFIDPTANAAVTSAPRGGILTLFITGDGDASPPVVSGAPPPANTPVANLPAPRLPVTITVGGVPAKPPFQFIGIPTWSIGVTQINFTVPRTAPLGPQPVVVTAGGVASAPATLTVTQ